MTMTPQDLRHAAAEITAMGNKYTRLADQADAADKPELAALHGAVAQQLYDRANQVRVWADQAKHIGDVTAEMEAGTLEFLAYAGCA